jgi:hypothetical protein
MSSKNIKDHYREFVNTARQQGVIHTSHGRILLVSLAFEKFEDIANSLADIKPKYKSALKSLKNQGKGKSILGFAGAGKTHSSFKANNEIDNLSNEWS